LFVVQHSAVAFRDGRQSDEGDGAQAEQDVHRARRHQQRLTKKKKKKKNSRRTKIDQVLFEVVCYQAVEGLNRSACMLITASRFVVG